MQLDLEFVRQQFTQIHDDADFVFAANAGGSYVCNQVNNVMENYNRHTRVQPYSSFTPSREAGQAMDRARQGWASALNIDLEELTIGPSTSINTYVMAQAIAASIIPGDEIIVTNQDHEANSGVWRRMAAARGASVRQWAVDAESGLLDPDDLLELLTDKTRWLFFTHCSNIVGTANAVADIVKLARKNSRAKVFVDAVAYAPHHICDLRELGVDGYVFSLYKVYGPHQGILYINKNSRSELSSQAHYFLAGDPQKDFNPAGPQHAQVAACAGVLDYFEALHRHHFDNHELSSAHKMRDLATLIQTHENQLTKPLLDYLTQHRDVRLIGKTHIEDNDRAPTIAFKPLRQSSADLAARLQKSGIGTENGDFYAHRLVTDLGIDPADGVVRISLLHYNRIEDVDTILTALDRALV